VANLAARSRIESVLPLHLSPRGLAEVGPLPPGRRVVVVVRVMSPSERSFELRFFVNKDDAGPRTSLHDPHFAGAAGIFGLGIALEKLPLESPMRKEPSVHEHRIDITRALDRVAPERDAIVLKVVAVTLEDEPVAVGELPIESIAVDLEG